MNDDELYNKLMTFLFAEDIRLENLVNESDSIAKRELTPVSVRFLLFRLQDKVYFDDFFKRLIAYLGIR